MCQNEEWEWPARSAFFWLAGSSLLGLGSLLDLGTGWGRESWSRKPEAEQQAPYQRPGQVGIDGWGLAPSCVPKLIRVPCFIMACCQLCQVTHTSSQMLLAISVSNTRACTSAQRAFLAASETSSTIRSAGLYVPSGRLVFSASLDQVVLLEEADQLKCPEKT